MLLLLTCRTALHKVAQRLDDHPLLETLHLDEEEGVVVVRATLRADADARTYGFRDGDTVTLCGDSEGGGSEEKKGASHCVARSIAAARAASSGTRSTWAQ